MLQSGFHGDYSTETALIHLFDHLKCQSTNGLYTGMIMLDLQKAFDTVDHRILCDKLKAMGVQNVRWFELYLAHRKQIVAVKQSLSSANTVTCGVPQGSILGPLLFLCYMNDMELCVSKDSQLLLYADDSVIMYSSKDPKDIKTKLTAELQSCKTWLINNKLSLHLGKTECIIFGTKQKLREISNFQIELDGHVIQAQDKVKYLGVEIDQTLSGTYIVDNIVK